MARQRLAGALDLSRRSGTITGSVRDARGQPVPGARVWLADPTAMGEAESGPRFAEALRVDPAAGWWHWVESDADGIHAGAWRGNEPEPAGRDHVGEEDHVAADHGQDAVEQLRGRRRARQEHEDQCRRGTEASIHQNAWPMLKWSARRGSSSPPTILRSILNPTSNRIGPTGDWYRRPKP